MEFIKHYAMKTYWGVESLRVVLPRLQCNNNNIAFDDTNSHFIR
jgi:hypothetical protein